MKFGCRDNPRGHASLFLQYMNYWTSFSLFLVTAQDTGEAVHEDGTPIIRFTGTGPLSRGGCREDYVECNNTQCVHKDWMCDGDNDCGDKSDEEIDSCSEYTFS